MSFEGCVLIFFNILSLGLFFSLSRHCCFGAEERCGSFVQLGGWQFPEEAPFISRFNPLMSERVLLLLKKKKCEQWIRAHEADGLHVFMSRPFAFIDAKAALFCFF